MAAGLMRLLDETKRRTEYARKSRRRVRYYTPEGAMNASIDLIRRHFGTPAPTLGDAPAKEH